ncbi:UTP--glucose-1-phosphate uridylyltransferase GalU [Gulosibacter chungangensis]|uniref:UTP--glucose-1-phosphate uridylyltransferase n=1 Tax=Gulosibacter chungangensis TaxID=979746 RepID=A0A7J5B7V2_9MICO|nr:UTP--glucose-1-phosphate uridylyltransferase GalU [Gulosibacter chungangensis]KAB1641018.1 UTP--glucose-1-phosphate uridylyltransferase GalU [Gulosibacter chungangensis]
MNFDVTKAVIPAAGLGTRFLPATKAIPKEMLPVVDRPAIQYVVEEAVHAGLDDILMVTGRNKTPLENHFDRVPALEAALKNRGDDKRLRAVRQASELADVHYLRQGSPLGLGHAVLRAEQHVGGKSFAVLLGDDIIENGGELMKAMIDVHRETGASVVAVQKVPEEQVSSYGVISPDAERSQKVPLADDGSWQALWVNGLVEKPRLKEAPSNLAIIGRYVLRSEVFQVLHETDPGRGGEIQLTDALQTMATRPDLGGVVALVFSGRRFDTGNKLDYLKANIEFAMVHPEIGSQVREWIREYSLQMDKLTDPDPLLN